MCVHAGWRGSGDGDVFPDARDTHDLPQNAFSPGSDVDNLTADRLWESNKCDWARGGLSKVNWSFTPSQPVRLYRGEV